jgi:hypothetical protein
MSRACTYIFLADYKLVVLTFLAIEAQFGEAQGKRGKVATHFSQQQQQQRALRPRRTRGGLARWPARGGKNPAGLRRLVSGPEAAVGQVIATRPVLRPC